MVNRVLAAASIAAALAGCSVPEHESPYDPQTPPALQARAILRGTVVLERLGDVPPAREGVNVSVAGVGAAVTNAAGEWMLPEVPPGTYQVQTIKEGYETAEVGGVVVTLDDGGQDVWVAPIAMDVARGTLAGLVQLSAGAVDGFVPGDDLSGVVVTLSGTGIPLPAAVSDATGAYRFVGVPASLAGAAYTVRASRPFHVGAETTATVAANATSTAPLLTLVVNPAAATGVARLWDNVANAGANGSSAGIDVSLTGTAFNGTAFSKATTTLADGSFSLAPLPAGTYDVVASSDSRACGAFARVTVAPGGAATLGTVDCVDAVAPGALALGDPIAPAGGESGYTRLDTVSVPIALQAADDTLPAGNFAGYEIFVGPVGVWEKATFLPGTPALLAFAGLAPDARNTLWARGVDWAGNAGPVAGVTVVQDGLEPPVPTISTPRPFVDATTTSVTLSGGEKDQNFSGYQTCTSEVPATVACPLAPACAFADAPAASFALSLALGQRTCLYARAVDRAGNASAASSLAVVSDLQPPTGPTIAPLFDPTALRIHGEYVDFAVTSPATDGPAGGGDPWRNVAWVEVDAGNGFTPLCPAPACRPGGVYSPCDPGCGCADRALLCRGATFAGIRLPLLGNRANEIAVRAVDLASNVGSGASQQVQTTPDEMVIRAEPGMDETPRARGRLVTFASIDRAIDTYSTFLTDTGPDGIWDRGDTTCPIAYPGAYAGPSHAEPISNSAIVYVDGMRYVNVRRPGADGRWCTADDTASTIWETGGTSYVRVVSGGPGADGTKERAAWAHADAAGTWRLYVREPGADGKLDGVGDTTAVVVAATASQIGFLRLAGDVLLYEAGGRFTVANAGAAGFSSVTSWALPTAAKGAGLSADGKVLAWLEGGSGTAVLKVKQAGANGDFEASDPEISRTGGPSIYGADVAVEGGHVAAVENIVGGAADTYYVEHWYAGGDGAFGTADDKFARTLPSSRPRHGPTLSTGVASGRLYYNVGASGYVGEDPDILATDLTATRWEVARDVAVSGPETNGAGTVFYRDDATAIVCARTSDGRETCSPDGIWTYVAEGGRLYTADGSTAWVSAPDGNGQWFTPTAPTPVPFYSGFLIVVAARDGYVVGQTADALGNTTHSLLRWNGASTSVVRLDDPARFPGVTQHTTAWGMGVSAQHAVWGCLDGGYWRPCVRSAVNGVFGDGDDVSLIPEWPGAPGTRYSSTNLAVSGNRLVFVAYKAGEDRLVVLDAGADKRFNSADDRETDLGPLGVNARDALDVAGDFVAFADFVPGLGGTQLNLLDLRDLSRRTLTDWYSFKPEVRVEPSGRLYWLDQIFQAKSLFVWSP
jgi:hypothetical protein